MEGRKINLEYIKAKTQTNRPDLMLPAGSLFKLELQIKELIQEVERKKDLPRFFKQKVGGGESW